MEGSREAFCAWPMNCKVPKGAYSAIEKTKVFDRSRSVVRVSRGSTRVATHAHSTNAARPTAARPTKAFAPCAEAPFSSPVSLSNVSV